MERGDKVSLVNGSGLAYNVVEVLDDGWVRICAVGDDYAWNVEASELAPLDEDEFCRSCGALDCGHDRSE